MMKKLTALMLCLLLCACALAEEAPLAPPVQAPVPEAEELALSPEAPGEAGLEIAAAEAAGSASTPKPTATPEPTATPKPALALKRFASTKVIKSAKTYSRLNLVRKEGFDGALAEVRGTLTLDNAEVMGVPASGANLLKAFKLGPTGSIVVVDDEVPLAADVAAFSFNKGDKRRLHVSYRGNAVHAWNVRWAVSDSEVARVSKWGVVTALKKGKATVTGRYKGRELTCRVVVTDIVHVEDIALSETALELSMNRTRRLKAILSPDNTTEKAVKWRSGNPAVAVVDEKGRVTGVSEGTARIRATAANGKKAYCEVTVKRVEPEGLRFDCLYGVARLGETTKLKARLEPENCSYPELRFYSSDKSVARVDKTTGEITPVARGWTVITVKSAHNPALTATCRLCVIKAKGKRLSGLIIGLNPGHQRTTITRQYPMAPGSRKTGKGVKTGACGHYTRVNEYETTLAVGLKLRDKLKALGAKVVITRTDNDVMLTNIDRANMLNDAGVDIALQLHCNATNGDPRPEGCSTYYRNNSDWVPESRACADIIAAAISEITGCKNNNAHVYNDYMSLNWSNTPAILIEMGYISNPREDRLLASDEYRDLMADAIVEGLCRHFGR